MRLLLVVNPTASSVTERHRLAVEEALGEDHEVTVAETEGRCHAIELAGQAVAESLDAVVVLAGDGTVNEVANGLVGTSTALGVLPGGSTNVFSRTIGMGRRPGSAVDRLRAAMAGGAKRRIGLGLANDRYFLFHVGMGFDAAVVEQVEAHAPLKRALGQAAFAYCALTTWLCHYDRSEPRFTIRVGGDTDAAESLEATFAICLNTNPYTFVGARPLNVDPGATLDSPLSLVAFHNIDLRTLAAVIGSSMTASDKLRDMPDVTLRSELHAVKVVGRRPFPWQVDGDLAGTTSSLELSYEPACLDLFVSPTMAAADEN